MWLRLRISPEAAVLASAASPSGPGSLTESPQEPPATPALDGARDLEHAPARAGDDRPAPDRQDHERRDEADEPR